jgi:shikimate kinase
MRVSMRLNDSVYSSVFLVGPMGVGKTTIGKMLARDLGLKFIDSDQEVERRAGADISWIFDVEGEAGFRERECKAIEELSAQDGIVLSTGGGAVLREENRGHLRERGFVIFLDTSLEIQINRTRNDRKRPLLQNVDHRKVLKEMKQHRDPLYNSVADLRISVGDSGSKRVVTSIVGKMTEQGLLVE